GPLRSGGEWAASDGIPRALLRAIRQLRLYGRTRGRAGRRLRRATQLAEIARRLLARLQAQGWRGHGPEAERDHPGARRIPRAMALPPARRRDRPAAVPARRRWAAVAARRQVRRVRRLLELSGMPLHPEVRPGRRP